MQSRGRILGKEVLTCGRPAMERSVSLAEAPPPLPGSPFMFLGLRLGSFFVPLIFGAENSETRRFRIFPTPAPFELPPAVLCNPRPGRWYSWERVG